MKGYWLILSTEISDQSAQAEYGKQWEPIAKQYGARLNPTEVHPLQKESNNTARVIVVEFPTYEAAKKCYDDPACFEAKKFALRASRRDLIIFEGDLY